MQWPLGKLAPDRPARLNDEYLRVADGCLPAADGYRSIGAWAQSIGPLPSAVKGAASFTRTFGTGLLVAGTATNLYRASGSGWESMADGFSIQGNGRWRFAQFGALGIATNGADSIRKINLETFACEPLGGVPPRAEILAVVNDFLFAGVIDGDALKVQWSGRNDAEYWTVAQRFSDFQKLPDGGRVNGILSGEYGIILQRNAIRRVDFVGGNTVFAFDVVSTNIGCVTPHSVAQWGRIGFFISDLGPAMWDGQQAVQIGDEEWSKTFRDSYTIRDYETMTTAIDPRNSVVMWAMPDKIWVYNWRLNKASTIPYASPIIFSGVTKAVSIDETDPLVGVNDDNLDYAGLVTLDDASFKGGDPRLYVFSSSNAVGTFTGASQTATFTGNDIGMDRNIKLRRSRPDVDGPVNMAFLQKQTLSSTGTSTSFTVTETNGHMNTRLNARYLRPTLTTSSSWTYAKGVDFDLVAGNRL